MRAFLAIDLPDDLRDRLADLQSALPVGRAVPVDNLHLTLAFLDDQDDATLAALDAELSALAPPDFDLSPQGVGVFGGDRPKLLYAGIADSAALIDLRRRVLGAVRRAGITLRRERFHPHVTLARFGAGLRGPDLAALQAFLAAHMGFRGPVLRVRGFGLFESVLRPQGALHRELAHYPPFPGSEAGGPGA